MFNSLMLNFSELLNNSIDRLGIVILYITYLIGISDMTLAFIHQYSEEFKNIIRILLTKLFRYTFIIVIITNYKAIINEIIKIIFSIGYLFYPSSYQGNISINNIFMPDFDKIYGTLNTANVTIEIISNGLGLWQIGEKLLLLALQIIIYIAIFLIIKEIIINFIILKVTAVIGMILLPFNVFEQTKPIGEKLFHTLLSCSSQLLMSIALTGIMLQVMLSDLIPFPNKSSSFGDIAMWVFLVMLCAYLITKSKEFGSMLVNGTTSSNDSSALSGALTGTVGTVATVGGAIATGGAATLGATAKGIEAYKSGKNMKGIIKSASAGAKEGRNLLQNSRLARIGRRTVRGIDSAIAYGSGQRGISNLGKDLVSGIAGTISEQTFDYRKSEQEDRLFNLFHDDAGTVEDYIKNKDIKEYIDKSKEEFTKEMEKELSHLSPEDKIKRTSKYRKAVNEFMKKKKYDLAKTKYQPILDSQEYNKQARKLWEEKRKKYIYITGIDSMGKYDEKKARELFGDDLDYYMKNKIKKENKRNIFDEI